MFFLKVHNVGAEQMSSGRLFQATGPATQNARLPSCSLVLGTTKFATGSETKNRKVGNSRNWDSLFVEITWCQAVDCLYTRTQVCNA